MNLAQLFKSIADSTWFRSFIMLVIIFAGILVGLETYPSIVEKHGQTLLWLNFVVHVIFLVEMVIRIGAYGKHPLRFFKDPWNVFDFVIVALCILPFDTRYLAVLRLARVLRVLRLVTALPRLQVLVGALLKSIPSLGYITILLFLFFYVYACIGTFLFGGNDPMHFGTLDRSLISLFQIVTLEGWDQFFHIAYYGSDVWPYDFITFRPVESVARPLASVLYFFSFILLGTMIILNLFVGVILNGMLEMETESTAEDLQQKREKGTLTLGEELHILLEDVENIKQQLGGISQKMISDSKAKK